MRLIHSHIAPLWSADGSASMIAAEALTDRDPASTALLAWPSATTSVSLSCSFPKRPIGGLALLATGLPAGGTVTLKSKPTSGGSYSVTIGWQSVVALPGGGTGAIFEANESASYGLELTIAYSGAPSAGNIVIGEIVVGQAITTDIETGWESSDTDASRITRTLGSAVHRVTRPGYRKLSCTPALTDHDEALATGLDGTSWQAIRNTLRRDPYVIAIPLTGTQADINATAIYGIVTRLPTIASKPGPNYQPSEMTVEELPG